MYQVSRQYAGLHFSPKALLMTKSWCSPLVFVGVRVPHTAGLLAGGSGGSEAQRLLDVLPDGHRAEDVEEYEAAVRHVVTQQVPVAQT